MSKDPHRFGPAQRFWGTLIGVVVGLAAGILLLAAICTTPDGEPSLAVVTLTPTTEPYQTATPTITNTPWPTEAPTSTPTAIVVPSEVIYATATRTPMPTWTASPVPTDTPVPTETPARPLQLPRAGGG